METLFSQPTLPGPQRRLDRQTRQYMRIDHKKQLFLDNRIIEEVRNVRRVQHQPVKHPGNPLIKQDRPWEKAVYFRTSNYSIAYDPERKLFRCWYEDLNQKSERDGSDYGESGALLYAESADGLHWEKPLFDRVLFDGKKTNILIQGSGCLNAMPHSATILYDPYDPDSSRRYKMMYNGLRKNANCPKKNEQRIPAGAGLCLAFSSDGIDWTGYPDNPVVLDWGSDVELLNYDVVRRRYVVMGRSDGPWYSPHPDFGHFFAPTRPNDMRGAAYPVRMVYRLESPDCIHWSEPVLVFVPDQTDNLDDQHYSLTHWYVDDYHMGMLTVFHAVPNTVTLQLAWSYDGIQWYRAQTRPDLIPLGAEGSCDCFMAECPVPPITVDDEHWLFYSGARVHHDWTDVQPPGCVDDHIEAHIVEDLAGGTHLCLAKIGVDRWVSLCAFRREGYVQTFPIFSTGSKLIINAKCGSDGYVLAEISDNWNNPWPGFRRGDCDVFRGDAVNHTVSWKGRSDVNTIPGIIKIRLYMRNAHLYSFRVADE